MQHDKGKLPITLLLFVFYEYLISMPSQELRWLVILNLIFLNLLSISSTLFNSFFILWTRNTLPVNESWRFFIVFLELGTLFKIFCYFIYSSYNWTRLLAIGKLLSIQSQISNISCFCCHSRSYLTPLGSRNNRNTEEVVW